MNILVTGGAGFIGSHVVQTLLGRGDEVIMVDDFNDYYDPAIKHQRIPSSDRLRVYELDIRSPKLDEVFATNHIDAVVHLAARAGVRPSLENPQLYYDVNVMGTLNLLEAMRKHSVARLVFASSSSVYGNRTDGPFSETDNTDSQVSPYGASKKAGELLCHSYAHLYGIATTCLRFFTVFGPGNRPDLACYTFMDAIAHDRPINQFGDGTTGRDYTFVSDTVRGILAAVDQETWQYEIINLGNSHPILLKDMISTISTVVGKQAVIIQQPSQPGDVQFTFAAISKAKRLLNWEPEIAFEDGIIRMWQWYKEVHRG